MTTITTATPQLIAGLPTAAIVRDVEKHSLDREPEVRQMSDDHGHNQNDIEKDSTDGTYKQEGVKRIEAITTVWSKKLLWVMFVLLYLVTFCDQLLQAVQGNLTPYVTSEFSQHGLLATTSIVASIIGGVSTLTIAKIIDIWGRCEGFLAMLVMIIVGMVMKATCQNVETYAAAHTIYWVGHLGLIYVIDVMLADITSLQNRMIMFGINTTPTIATNFAGPKIADLFYVHSNFRWAFGAFCIILVAFCVPVAMVFIYSQRKANKAGVVSVKTEKRGVWGSFTYYFVQFDTIGMLLTTFGWSLLLLPFNLANTAPNGWATGYIIAMIILGVLLLVGFVIWEKYFAPVAYFPFRFLTDRTILGACLLYGIMFTSIFCWDAYYSSYLQVVHDLNIANSGYVLNSFSLMSAFIAPFVGLLIRYTGKFKWLAYAGMPFCVLGTVLLIHFRTPSSHVGYLVMCQLFNGISSGIWASTAQLSVMASVTHQEIAVSLALWGMFGSIGAAIGLAIAGALWTNVLPTALYNNLPLDSKDLAATIYGSIVVQKSYPMGSPIRDAIIAAYADVQRKMVIAGAAFTPLLLVCIIIGKNINVRKLEEGHSKQSKGNVW
ncbi:Siderophore iron transporter mirB 2 [Phlyctema vagabunda]|uniref:Siderophore iron transporter mirB 2 n=1 Tax=Phlyctema vagabunda TaxID=108571 RepID=A0ABR4PNS4_9HELO